MKEDLSNRIGPPSAHRAVASEKKLGDRLLVPSVAPPFARGLPWRGDHRSEQLGDDHEFRIAQHRAGDGIGVIARSRRLLVQRQSWGKGIVAEGAEDLDRGGANTWVRSRARDQGKRGPTGAHRKIA